MEGGAADRNHSGEGQGGAHTTGNHRGEGEDTMGWAGGGGGLAASLSLSVCLCFCVSCVLCVLLVGLVAGGPSEVAHRRTQNEKCRGGGGSGRRAQERATFSKGSQAHRGP